MKYYKITYKKNGIFQCGLIKCNSFMDLEEYCKGIDLIAYNEYSEEDVKYALKKNMPITDINKGV